MANVFTYGSLMFEKVTYGLVKNKYQHVPATLNGYTRRKVLGAVYPGITPSKEGIVNGELWLSLKEEDLQILDSFEGTEYIRREVIVKIKSGQQIKAYVYVMADPERLSKEEWSVQTFKKQSMHDFVFTRFF